MSQPDRILAGRVQGLDCKAFVLHGEPAPLIVIMADPAVSRPVLPDSVAEAFVQMIRLQAAFRCYPPHELQFFRTQALHRNDGTGLEVRRLELYRSQVVGDVAVPEEFSHAVLTRVCSLLAQCTDFRPVPAIRHALGLPTCNLAE